MTHTSQAQGEVIVEDDFDLALDQHSEQLTSDDVVEVKGDFSVGDTILVRKGDGTKLAKAKSNYSSCLLSFITEQDDQAFASEFQQKTGPIISDKNIARFYFGTNSDHTIFIQIFGSFFRNVRNIISQLFVT